jgi:hypothetical protein
MKQIVQQTFSSIILQKKTILAALGLLAVALLALALPAREAQAQPQQRGNPFTLVGTWMHSIPPAPYPFTSYETFNEGGGSVIMDHGTGGPSAGIGTWTRIGPREFLATYYKPVHRPAEAGPFPFVPDGTIKVRRHITINPDGLTLTGQTTVEVFDQEGNLILSGGGCCFTSVRLFPEPPDM